MKILLLSGSGNTHSHSHTLGESIENELIKLGVETELVDLSKLKLPPYDWSTEHNEEWDDTTTEFLRKSYEADAFVWITPIYHNSYSSVLKTALDWQHSTFPGKVVGLASNGGSRSPQAVDQLLMVARAQHLIPIPTRVCTDASDYDDDKKLVDEGIKRRIVTFCDELHSLTTKVAS